MAFYEKADSFLTQNLKAATEKIVQSLGTYTQDIRVMTFCGPMRFISIFMELNLQEMVLMI